MSPDCNIELFYCIAVPGEPYHLKNDTTLVPVPFPSVSNFSGMDQHIGVSCISVCYLVLLV